MSAPKSEPWRRDLFALAVQKMRGEPPGPCATAFSDEELRGLAIKYLERDLGGKLELGTPFVESIIADRILRIRADFADWDFCNSLRKRRPGRPNAGMYEAFVLFVARTDAEFELKRDGLKTSGRRIADRAANRFGWAVSADRIRRVHSTILQMLQLIGGSYGREVVDNVLSVTYRHASAMLAEAEAELRAGAAQKKSWRKLT